MHHVYSFLFIDPPTPEIYPLSLHDALPIFLRVQPRKLRVQRGLVQQVDVRAEPPLQFVVFMQRRRAGWRREKQVSVFARSEEHTSELQSHVNLVCRLLLEKKKYNKNKFIFQ